MPIFLRLRFANRSYLLVLSSRRQLQVFLIQRVLVLGTLGILVDAVDRANRHALRLAVMADAFGAQFRIDHVKLFALGNGAVRAFRLADVAVDAFVADFKGHGGLLLLTEFFD
jgi:microcompartment protein CcmK/EutM